MPPKRKIPGIGEKIPSSKRVRIASGTPPLTRTRSPETEKDKQDENGNARTAPRTPGIDVGAEDVGGSKRGPGRPRRNTLETLKQNHNQAPSTPKAGGAGGRPRKTSSIGRKGRSSVETEVETDKAGPRAEAEEEDVELPPTAPIEDTDDVFDPLSSGDELSQSQRVNPTPKRRPKPKITYKSRRTSLGEADEEEGEGDPLVRTPHITRSSPIKVAEKTVEIPTTPATTIKPRSKPPRARKKDAPRPDAPPSTVAEEVTPSATVRGNRMSYGSLHETDAEGEDEDVEVDLGAEEIDPDEDFVGADGRISAAAPATVKKDKEREKANRRRSMPTPAKKTVVLEGMEDPFAIPEEPSRSPEKPQKQKNGAPQKKFDRNAMKVLKKMILPKLMGRERAKLVGVDEEESHVQKLLEQTVAAGEGNSMLIIGARGSGKTTLVENAISNLKGKHPQDFLVVRLNGFHQTDDRIALREIWRQLGVEMDLDAADTAKTSFADTLSSILALLSHPDELQHPDEEGEDAPEQPKASLSVIFLLEEFDLFTTHPRQTLLYNLFDIAQARKAPIAVIGTTTRIDITNTLEKRVKSRFSHRTIHLTPPRTLAAFWDIVCASLAIDAEVAHRHPIFEQWNSHLDSLYNTPQFQSHLRRVFARSADTKAFLNSCILPVAALSDACVFPPASAFAPTLSEPDSILSILDGLTDLELTLLIAAARLDIVSDTDTCNFAMAYDEYTTLVGGVKIAAAAAGVVAGRVWGREVARGAWERLARYGLLTAVGKGGNEGMWRVEVGLGEIGAVIEKGGAGAGRGALGKWCREV